jgi:hypothetical protein
MKKAVLLLLFVLLFGSSVCAEELTINLSSGNTIVVQYTGSIQGVTMQGTGDTIAGVSMPQAVTPPASVSRQGTGVEQTAGVQEEKGKSKTKKETGGVRFQWAEPISED